MLYVKVIINAIAKANCSSDCLHLQTYFDTGHICLKLTLSSRMIEWKVGLIFRRGQQQRNGPGKMGTFKQAQQKRKCPVSNREGGGILRGLASHSMHTLGWTLLALIFHTFILHKSDMAWRDVKFRMDEKWLRPCIFFWCPTLCTGTGQMDVKLVFLGGKYAYCKGWMSWCQVVLTDVCG